MKRKKTNEADHRKTDWADAIHRPNGKPLERVDNLTSSNFKSQSLYEVMPVTKVSKVKDDRPIMANDFARRSR